MSEYELVLRLLLALICGGLIGAERHAFHKPAGARTLMLVAMGACLFTIVSIMAGQNLGEVFNISATTGNIVIGVGFLAAGLIIQSRGEVMGLTTAVSMWLVAGIGMACGFGMFITAASATILALIVLHFLERFEEDKK